MNTTENHGFYLFEGEDRMSRKAFNENAEHLDEILTSVGKELDARVKIQTGSWSGKTASASPRSYTVQTSSTGSGSKSVSTNYGDPVSSAGDIVLTLDFEPKMLLVSAFQSAAFSWSGYLKQDYIGTDDLWYTKYNSFSFYGTEHRAYQQVIHRGLTICPVKFRHRRPAIVSETLAMLHSADGAAWEGEDWEESSAYVVFGTTSDGKYTVTIKGASSVYGTENYADIEGMTYNWVAFG